MDHQPFETWLVSEEPLTPEQQSSLQAHLQDCPRCQNLERTWNQVETLLGERPVVQPAIGFTLRWQARLETFHQTQRSQQQRRVSWIFIAATLSVAIALLAFMAIRTLSSFESPTQILVNGLTLITSLLASITALQDFLTASAKVLPQVIPTGWWFGILVTISLLLLTWVESLRRLVFSRRIVR